MREYSLPVRVYIEDTDAGGIVYYVNYLKFMERARTEWMRSAGYGKTAIFSHDSMFVVTETAIKYLKPATLDDELIVTAAVSAVRGVSITFEQSVRRGSEILCQGSVQVACVDRQSLKPRRIPADMRAQLQNGE
ncbi:tol-pal system-associated acyl-CoA thioesterase [Litorivivens lipolytica]|uniref:Tol-pal system-associated acyl-CoA thioesterase n=1 Tax=Litorivivens lipolytica TaxID=1524264 RepID=A0A7W4W4Q5_9GAMM|nr:tol-pal system-associated acyl-CoA thioesterase [Litorivivens lipolytica]MBB3047377.1 tol-pal system-associated acyl-CoA thioesterase [Litorivivens lipolytica]